MAFVTALSHSTGTAAGRTVVPASNCMVPKGDLALPTTESFNHCSLSAKMMATSVRDKVKDPTIKVPITTPVVMAATRPS